MVQVQGLQQATTTMSFAGVAQPLYVVGTVPLAIITVFMPPAEAGLEVAADVEVDATTRLERASFFVAASPSDTTRIGSVAEVRDGDSGTCVVDFGRMVTVAGVSMRLGASGSITGVQRWNGVDWESLSVRDPGSFAEVATERLLLSLDDVDGGADAVAEDGVVVLPAQPTQLELVVDGTVVWFERQGSTAGLVTRQDGRDRVVRSGWTSGAVEYGVDRTDALRDALAKARVEDGKRRVQVRFRAATPGTLRIASDLQLLHEHSVDFGAGQRRTSVNLEEEGVRTVALPGPPFAAADSIREVAATLTGAFGPERVAPVTGPAALADADLVVTVGRAVLFGLPVSLSLPFGEVQGVRLQVRPLGGRTAELAGRVFAADPASGLPTEPVPGAELSPLEVAAGHDGWLTLTFAEPAPVPDPSTGPVACWLELSASYGEVACGLTADVTRGAPVLRRLPGGGFKQLSELRSPYAAGVVPRVALRIVGLPGRKAPVPAVTLGVGLEAAAGAAGTAVASADATRDALRVVLGLGSGVPAAGGAVPLSLSLAAPGSVTLEDVVVAYRKAGA